MTDGTGKGTGGGILDQDAVTLVRGVVNTGRVPSGRVTSEAFTVRHAHSPPIRWRA